MVSMEEIVNAIVANRGGLWESIFFDKCLYLPPLLDSAYYAIVKGHIDVTIVLYTVSRIDFKG